VVANSSFSSFGRGSAIAFDAGFNPYQRACLNRKGALVDDWALDR
jgi:hypothetical protein